MKSPSLCLYVPVFLHRVLESCGIQLDIYVYFCLYPSTHQSSLMDMLISDQLPGLMPINSHMDDVPVSYLLTDKILWCVWHQHIIYAPSCIHHSLMNICLVSFLCIYKWYKMKCIWFITTCRPTCSLPHPVALPTFLCDVLCCTLVVITVVCDDPHARMEPKHWGHRHDCAATPIHSLC